MMFLGNMKTIILQLLAEKLSRAVSMMPQILVKSAALVSHNNQGKLNKFGTKLFMICLNG